MSEKHFIEGCENLWKEGKGSVEILNWYRNLYYKEEPDTERKTVADALNDILPELTKLREKQMPKKTTKRQYVPNGTLIYGHCPICDCFTKNFFKYCRNCGQALDWSDTE